MTRSKTLVAIGAVLAAAGITTAAVGYGAGSSSTGTPTDSYTVTPYAPPSSQAAPSTLGTAPSRITPPPGSTRRTGTVTGVAKPTGSPSRVYVIRAGGTTIVDAPLTPTYVDARGILAPPPRIAGWYANSGWAMPGYAGASILVGHITYSGAPDTFYRLPRTAPGDTIVVRYSSGQQTVFTVTRSAAESKAAVPKDGTIWDASSKTPLLRLITCDPTTPVKNGHFEGNWVVWAKPA